VVVGPEKIVDACKLVVQDGEFYHLTTITAIDEGQVISIFYHFWRGKEFLTVKTSVPKTEPRLQSITEAVPAAVFYEAEVADLLGVTFVGSPMAGKKLLLPDSYPPQAPPPLRKESNPAQLRKMMGLD
jgi:Ni,Fe-hydrogenase III component G